MNTLAGWLLAISGTLAARVLIALGIGWVSYSGIEVALEEVRAHITTAWSAAPASVTTVLGIAGIGDAVGIIMAALTARATLYGMAHLARVTR